jgi:tryptophan synthase alpha chain
LSQPSRIAGVFAARRQLNQMAFMPFLTAGDPDLTVTARLVEELAAAGADLIEIGFPYSDPIADGPVIQSSYTRALAGRLHIPDIFTTMAVVSQKIKTPLVAMVSYAIIFRIGNEAFVKQAAESGFAGLIVPDLPGDEADEFHALVQRHGLDLIQLVAPTTPADRSARILKNASGFVYCIAVAGTTGTRETLAPQLAGMLKTLRSQTTLPLAVGFGLSRPEQVEQLRGLADGAIVGSAIVRHLEGLSTDPGKIDDVVRRLVEYAGSIATAAHSSLG